MLANQVGTALDTWESDKVAAHLHVGIVSTVPEPRCRLDLPSLIQVPPVVRGEKREIASLPAMTLAFARVYGGSTVVP
jgi:hypothetical protein